MTEKDDALLPGGVSIDRPMLDPLTGLWHIPAMSLRDYFAAAALPGLFHTVGQFDDVPADTIPVALADAAYEIADAMLAEREKEPNK